MLAVYHQAALESLKEGEGKLGKRYILRLPQIRTVISILGAPILVFTRVFYDLTYKTRLICFDGSAVITSVYHLGLCFLIQ